VKYLIRRSNLLAISKSHRANYERRAKATIAQIEIMSHEDNYAKSGGQRKFEFRSYGQIRKFAKTIYRELISTKLKYEDAILLIALRIISQYPDIKRAYIPKAGERNGLRPLGIPPHQTKALEYLMLKLINNNLLTRHNELKKLNIEMFGFLPGHNAKMPRSIIQTNLKDGYCFCLNGDQSGAFDAVKANIRQQLCTEQFGYEVGTVCNKFAGRKVTAKQVGYIDNMGMVSYHDQNIEVYRKKFVSGIPSYQVNVKGNGTPQGGVISPNIFWLVMSEVLKQFAVIRGNNDDMRIVCYADDFVIMTKTDTSKSDKQLLKSLCTEFGLNLNEDKTYLSKDSTSFLGWTIKADRFYPNLEHVDGRNFKYMFDGIREGLELFDNDNWDKEYNWNDYANELLEGHLKPSRFNNNKAVISELALKVTVGIFRYYCDYKPSKAVEEHLKQLRINNPQLPSFIKKQLSIRKPTADNVDTRLATEDECSKFVSLLTKATTCVAPDEYLDKPSQKLSNAEDDTEWLEFLLSCQ
jgi:hypothetical protein